MAYIDFLKKKLKNLLFILYEPDLTCDLTLFEIEKIQKEVQGLIITIKKYQNATLLEHNEEKESVHNMIEEVKQNEPIEVECQVNELESPLHEEFSVIKNVLESNSCMETSQFVHCPLPPDFYYKIYFKNQYEPLLYHSYFENIMLITPELKCIILHERENKHYLMMLGINNFPFDPGGILFCVKFVTWFLYYKIWDPGGSFTRSSFGP